MKIILSWLATFFFLNTGAAVSVYHIMPDTHFLQHLIFNHCIGFGFIGTILTAFVLFKPRSTAIRVLTMFIAGNIGIVTGMLTGIYWSQLKVGFNVFSELHFTFNLLGFAIVGSTFYWQYRMDANEDLNCQKLKRLKLERKVEQNRLMALQAEIEPNFIFQTLREITALMRIDPQKGKHMQLSLIRYLRASLSKIRVGAVTLSQQLEMLQAYFEIHKTGDCRNLRLKTRMPEALRHYLLPPMLLQPLVAHAIARQAGSAERDNEILIQAEETADRLCVTFRDNRNGGDASERYYPVELIDALKDRLKTLFGKDGHLSFNSNTGLVEAVIQVPKSIHTRLEDRRLKNDA